MYVTDTDYRLYRDGVHYWLHVKESSYDDDELPHGDSTEYTEYLTPLEANDFMSREQLFETMYDPANDIQIWIGSNIEWTYDYL